MYRVGDKVLVRQWNDMAKEFGLNECGSINTYCHFVDSMKKYCGKIVTIVKIFIHGSEISYEVEEDGGAWYWDDGMFTEPENSISYLLKGRGKRRCDLKKLHE